LCIIVFYYLKNIPLIPGENDEEGLYCAENSDFDICFHLFCRVSERQGFVSNMRGLPENRAALQG
jgi:hypothetical protein